MPRSAVFRRGTTRPRRRRSAIWWATPAAIATGDASLAATATITAAGFVTELSDASVAATATIGAGGFVTETTGATLAATATVTPAGFVTGATGAALSGTATVTTTATGTRITGASLAGTATIAAAGTTARPVSTLVDDFATQDTGKWTFTGTATVSGGRLDITPTSGYGNEANSVDTYDLTGSALFAEVAQVAGGTEIHVETYFGFAGAYFFDHLVNTNGTDSLEAYYTDLGGTNQLILTSTYNATNHRWWRIRESGGTVFYETSPDGATWNSFTSHAIVKPITSLRVQVGSGYYGATAGAGHALIDNVNVAPAVTGAASLAATATIGTAGFVDRPSGASLAGTASVTAAGALTELSGASLAGTATVAAAGFVARPTGASVAASATVTTAGFLTLVSGSTVSGTATITAAGAVGGIAALAATATIATAGFVVRPAAAALVGTASITTAGFTTLLGGTTLAGMATVTAAGLLVFTAAASLVSTATVTAVGDVPPRWGPPTGLTVTVISTTQLDLSWAAVQGASGYDIERSGVVIATDVAGTTYSDTGLAPSSTHTYRARSVRA